MEDNSLHNNEQNDIPAYAQDNIPYFEYSGARPPVNPPSPVPGQAPVPPLPSYPPQNYQQPVYQQPLYQQPMSQPLYQQLTPQPPRRSSNRGLIVTLAVVSIVLVIGVIFLATFSQIQQLFRRPSPTSTSITTVSTLAPTQQLAPTPTANFRSSPCPFQLGSGMVDGQSVKCGYVTVPLYHSNPNGPHLQLAVAIFKSSHVQNDPYPVVRLEGGPGGPSLDNWATYVSSSNYSNFVFNHDLIMFDQRGTGYSTPSLQCKETLQLQYQTLNQYLNATDANRLQMQALQTCRDRLVKSGIDLNAYNSLENAGDVHDLIVALGYKQANLYGVSYGTRLALTTMRLYPTVIHSVVLDSVYPPQRNRTDLPSDAQRVFNVLFHGCAIDTNCNAQYPNLDSVFYQLVTSLNATPVHFQTTDITTNKNYDVVMAGNDFVFVLFSALYVTQFIPALPKMIYQVRSGNYALLSQIYGAVEFDNTFSDGMFYSDECGEDWAFLKQSDITTAMQGITPQIQPALQGSLQQEYNTCQIWKVQQVPAIQKQAVVSDIPTLVLSDEYDPITPPANGQLTASTLKNSYYFVFPGLGHGAEYNSSCVDGIISAFDDNPTQKPHTPKHTQHSEPNFV